MSDRRGVTLLELLVFLGIFAIIIVSFMGVLVVVNRVQIRQSASLEVGQQSQFLLQAIQYNIERSSLVEMTTDFVTSTLKLRVSSSTVDPTYIYLSGGRVYLKETDVGIPQPLTSTRVNVTNLTFTKRANVPSKDSVAVSFTVEYATNNAQQQSSQSFTTAIARVSAATFDSNVLPAASNLYKIGAVAGDWQSINNTVYFGGTGNAYVGIGPGLTSPQQRLEVDGGVRLNTVTAQPTCGATIRGTIWFTQSGGAASDTVQACIRNNLGNYLWVNFY